MTAEKVGVKLAVVTPRHPSRPLCCRVCGGVQRSLRPAEYPDGYRWCSTCMALTAHDSEGADDV